MRANYYAHEDRDLPPEARAKIAALVAEINAAKAVVRVLRVIERRQRVLPLDLIRLLARIVIKL